MIPVADPFMADVRPTGLQRGRGGFLRAANDTPWVTHPDGTLVNSGPRKGEPLRVPYAQPSGAGRLIENDVGLTKYKQRNTLLGIGMSVELREACIDLAVLEAGSEEFRKAADTIVVEADNLTRSWLAADRGSHGHLLCEYTDRDDDTFNVRDLVEAGRALGLDDHTQAMVMGTWIALLRDNGLEILAIEASCVDDRWRLAGTLDRIVRCTRELRFARPDGQIVVIPAGTVLILDIKFGQIRRAHLIQCASYRQSVPYDTDTEQRGVWPWPIDPDHALIAHGDFGGDGIPPSFELVWIDLAAGREHGGRCVADAKTWSARDDLWSVAQLDVPGEGVGTSEVAGIADQQRFDSSPAATPGTPDVEGEVLLGTTHPSASSLGPQPAPSTLGTLSTGDKWVADPVPVVEWDTTISVSPQATQSPAAVNAGEVGSSADQPPHPPATIDDFSEFVNGDGKTPSREALAWASQPTPTPLPPLPDHPDEGPSMGDRWFRDIEAKYKALDATNRHWITRLVSEAARANVGFHTQGHHTQRRFNIVAGLVTLAEYGQTLRQHADDVLRALVTAALYNDAPLDPRHTPGHCVGSLDAAAAQRFATLAADYVGTSV